MSETEFDQLLDVVRDAMACDRGGDRMQALLAQLPLFGAPRTVRTFRKAANDNGKAWPLIPFPEGWYATC